MKTNIALISAAAGILVGAALLVHKLTEPPAAQPQQPVIELHDYQPPPETRELDRLAVALRETERRETAARLQEDRQNKFFDLESKLTSFALRQERIIDDLEERIAELEAENTRLREEQETLSVQLEQLQRRDFADN